MYAQILSCSKRKYPASVPARRVSPHAGRDVRKRLEQNIAVRCAHETSESVAESDQSNKGSAFATSTSESLCDSVISPQHQKQRVWRAFSPHPHMPVHFAGISLEHRERASSSFRQHRRQSHRSRNRLFNVQWHAVIGAGLDRSASQSNDAIGVFRCFTASGPYGAFRAKQQSQRKTLRPSAIVQT
jgi:hypothetical protein